MKTLKNKKLGYVLCSLSLVLALGLTACGNNTQNNSASTSNENANKQKTIEQNTDSNTKKPEETKKEVKAPATKNVNGLKFTKKKLDKNAKPSFSTAWKDSIDGNYSACIDGKGSEAIEEGVGKIIVKSSDNVFSYEITDNEKISPRSLEWVDKENILVVVGSSHGTVSKGGNLYMLNVNTGDALLVIETPSKKQQIMSAQKSGNNIKLKVNVYDDDVYNNSHIENWSISSFDSSLNSKMEVKNSDGKVVYVING